MAPYITDVSVIRELQEQRNVLYAHTHKPQVLALQLRRWCTLLRKLIDDFNVSDTVAKPPGVDELSLVEARRRVDAILSLLPSQEPSADECSKLADALRPHVSSQEPDAELIARMAEEMAEEALIKVEAAMECISGVEGRMASQIENFRSQLHKELTELRSAASEHRGDPARERTLWAEEIKQLMRRVSGIERMMEEFSRVDAANAAETDALGKRMSEWEQIYASMTDLMRQQSDELRRRFDELQSTNEQTAEVLAIHSVQLLDQDTRYADLEAEIEKQYDRVMQDIDEIDEHTELMMKQQSSPQLETNRRRVPAGAVSVIPPVVPDTSAKVAFLRGKIRQLSSRAEVEKFGETHYATMVEFRDELLKPFERKKVEFSVD